MKEECEQIPSPLTYYLRMPIKSLAHVYQQLYGGILLSFIQSLTRISFYVKFCFRAGISRILSRRFRTLLLHSWFPCDSTAFLFCICI